MPSLFERIRGLWSAPPAPSLHVRPDTSTARPARRDSIYNPLTGLGGLNDKGAVGRPSPYVFPLSTQELRTLYAFNGIARRVVDIIPARACRRGWSSPELDSDSERLHVWDRTEQAMTWARLYGGSIALMVTIDDVPPEFAQRPDAWLAEPLDLERVGRLAAIQVFDAIEATPVGVVRDLTDPEFRLPAAWRITAEGRSLLVHRSRVLHFRGLRRPPSDVRGGLTAISGMPDDSALQVIWEEIRRLTETLQGGAVLAQELRESVLEIAELTSRATGDEGAEVEARISELARTKAILGMVLLGSGEKYENRSNPPTGFNELSSAGWEALAAVTGIPQVILMGSTPGGLNTDGESSWEGFRQLVSTFQEEHRPLLNRLTEVQYAAQEGPTGGVKPEGAAITFAALDEPNEASIATTRNTVSAMDRNNISAGIYTADDVRRSRFSGVWSIDMLPVTDAAPTVTPTPAPTATPAATPAPTPNPATNTRVDELDPGALCVLVLAADPGLREEVEAITGPLTVELDPHVTVLYLGSGHTPEEEAEVVAIVQAETATLTRPVVATKGTVRAFPPGPDGQPVVVEFSDAWDLGALHDRLLTRLAHLVNARQHPTYRPHLTIGYAASALEVAAETALSAVDAESVAVPVSVLQVRRGPQVVAEARSGA